MLLSPTNGHVYLTETLILQPGNEFEMVKTQLTEENIDFRFEDSYGFYQSIYLNNILTEKKNFSIELKFEKYKLCGMLLDFTCANGYEITLEQWVAEMLNKKNNADWGNIKIEIHPKFDVILVDVKYK